MSLIMSLFVFYLIITALCLIFMAFYSWSRIRRDLRSRSDQCLTIGTVSMILFGLVSSFIPIWNATMLFYALLWTCLENQYVILDFFKQPICFWRKK